VYKRLSGVEEKKFVFKMHGKVIFYSAGVAAHDRKMDKTCLSSFGPKCKFTRWTPATNGERRPMTSPMGSG
jgi:hypothetical protein